MRTDKQIIQKIEQIGGINGPQTAVSMLAQFLSKEIGSPYIKSKELEKTLSWGIKKDPQILKNHILSIILHFTNAVELPDIQTMEKCISALMVYTWMLRG